MIAQDNTTYALIQGAQVAQLFTKEDIAEWNEEHILALALSEEQKQWVEVGMSYDEASKSILQPTLEEYKQSKLNYINAMFEMECNAIKGEIVPSDEQFSWSIQESEAKAYKASGKSEDCPMLVVLANSRGIELDALVAKVLEKNIAFQQAIAKLVGNRQALQDKVEACTNYKEVLGIEYISPFA